MSQNNSQQWTLTAITEALGDLQISVENELSIGRGKDNDVVLASKRVSRNHASLSVLKDELFVKDLGSSNGTLLNGNALEANKPLVANLDDVLSIAGFEFTVSLEDTPLEQPASANSDEQVSEEHAADKENSSDGDIAQSGAKTAVSVAVKELAESDDLTETSTAEKITAETEKKIEAEKQTDRGVEPDSLKDKAEEVVAETETETEQKQQSTEKQVLESENKAQNKEPEIPEQVDEASENTADSSPMLKESEKQGSQGETIEQPATSVSESLETAEVETSEVKADIQEQRTQLPSADVEESSTSIEAKIEAKHVEAPLPAKQSTQSLNWIVWIILATVIAVAFWMFG